MRTNHSYCNYKIYRERHFKHMFGDQREKGMTALILAQKLEYKFFTITILILELILKQIDSLCCTVRKTMICSCNCTESSTVTEEI